MKWKDIFKDKKSIADFFVTVLFVLLIILVFPVFLNFIELRDTDLMFDPFLDLFLPIDLTWITFGLIYFSVITEK